MVAGFDEDVPETLQGRILARAGSNKIGSVLTPERDRALALQLHEYSKGWGSNSYLYLYPRANGEMLLPPVELTAEEPIAGALGEYQNARINVGAETFASALSPKRAGLVVHEMTHHEQTFLIAARLADKSGLAAVDSIAPEHIEKLAADSTAVFNYLTPDIAQEFLHFRAGKQLTAAASERAEKLMASNTSLFDRAETGSKINLRLQNIDFWQKMIENPLNRESNRLTLERLIADPTSSELFEDVIPAKSYAEAATNIVSLLPKEEAATWSDKQLTQSIDTLSQFLDNTYLKARRELRTWDADYWSSLHEREARFNEYIAGQSLQNKIQAFSPRRSGPLIPVALEL
jgi:hypothetical protein